MIGVLGSSPVLSGPAFATPLLIDTARRRETARRYVDAITVGKAGQCADQPVLLIVLFDNSGSVTGGNDPIGQRFLEVALAIQRIGSRCKCGQCLTAIVHFDIPTSLDLDPTPITLSNMSRIAASLMIPPDGAGYSLLGPSLHGAQTLIKRFPDHHPVLVALTDFELFDDYLDEFIDFPGDVHAVVLRAAVPAKFESVDDLAVTKVRHTSKPGTVARAVFQALARNRPGAQPLPVEPRTD